MLEIHIEAGLQGVFLDYPASIEDAFLSFLRDRGVELGSSATVLESGTGVPLVQSVTIHQTVDIAMSAIDQWLEQEQIEPQKSNDGAGHFYWEFSLV